MITSYITDWELLYFILGALSVYLFSTIIDALLIWQRERTIRQVIAGSKTDIEHLEELRMM